MSKYDPLGSFLLIQNRDHIPMTFEEIEKIIGTQLPSSKQYPAWWSNNPWNNVMTQIWLDAGYKTESVNTASEKLIFRRVSPSDNPHNDNTPGSDNSAGSKNNVIAPKQNGAHRHPVFGCMQGTVTIPDGVDLTQPADPDWAQLIEREYSQK